MMNAEFERILDTSDEWIVTRTGIRERRIADNGLAASDLAVAACRNALDRAGCSHEDIDLLIAATVTPDYRLPSMACVIQEKMGLPNAVAYDVVAACTGFIIGLQSARALIECGVYKKVLVVGAEKLSSLLNWSDRGTCVLFGDGAGAAVVAASEDGESGVVSTFLRSDGSMRRLLWVPVGGSTAPHTPEFAFDGSDKIAMNGSDVFKIAVREMASAAQTVMDQAGIGPDDVALVVPHQANIRIIDALMRRLGISQDRVFLNIEKYGNTSAASIPIALDEASRGGRIRPGDHIVMVAFGGGLIWGAAVVKW